MPQLAPLHHPLLESQTILIETHLRGTLTPAPRGTDGSECLGVPGLLLLQRPHEGYKLLDLIVSQLALVGGHFAFSVGCDVR